VTLTNQAPFHLMLARLFRDCALGVTGEHARFRTVISRERQQPAVATSLASEIGIFK
jgi:hypothetical protein